jgi:hypothetical protein
MGTRFGSPAWLAPQDENVIVSGYCEYTHRPPAAGRIPANGQVGVVRATVPYRHAPPLASSPANTATWRAVRAASAGRSAEDVAEHLGNTRAVAERHYVKPRRVAEKGAVVLESIKALSAGLPFSGGKVAVDLDRVHDGESET